MVSNGFVNETQKPLEFRDHRFLIDPFTDLHPDQVVKKSAQVGFSVTAILKCLWLAKYHRLNIIYALPTKDIVQSFVQPKVDTLITGNPVIRDMVGTDSITTKEINQRFIHFKGTSSQRDAISTSADLLVLDEYDRAISMNVVKTFDSRLNASEFAWRWRFSNPSSIGFGVDQLYSESDQMHWFIQCHKCREWEYLDFEPGEGNHYLDQEKEVYRCGKCHAELTDSDRRNGQWVAKYASRKRRGYWISQLMAPNISASKVMEQFYDEETEHFYNFVLGKAYTPSDLLIDRETITRALRPGLVQMRNVVMGTDVGKPHWYWLGTPNGIFKTGKTDSWDELERLFKLHQCEAWVIDAQPEFTKVQEMIRKYPGKAFGCYFVRDTKEVGMIRWGEGLKRGTVQADRTKIIDRVVTEVASQDISFYLPKSDLEDLIKHASYMYRTVQTDEKGKMKIDWQTQIGKPDHLVFALVYWRIALEKAFSAAGPGMVETSLRTGGVTSPTVKDGKIQVEFDIASSLDRAERKG